MNTVHDARNFENEPVDVAGQDVWVMNPDDAAKLLDLAAALDDRAKLGILRWMGQLPSARFLTNDANQV